MTYGEIIKLLDAGYTKAEIDALMAAPEKNQAEPEKKPAEPEKKPAEQEKPKEDPRIEQLTNTVSKLIDAVKLMNVQTMQMKDPEPLSIEQTLANIIEPPKKDK